MATPSATVAIQHVEIQLGQALVLWLDTGGETVQLEVQLRRTGEIALYCDRELKTEPFIKWIRTF